MSRRGLLAALVAAAAAFALYRATLLPGVDFGDTGSFQTMVGSPLITPRDGYPLYFAIGTVVLWLTRTEPAHALTLASAVGAAVRCLTRSPPGHALNLASAIEASAACGLILLPPAHLRLSIAAALGV